MVSACPNLNGALAVKKMPSCERESGNVPMQAISVSDYRKYCALYLAEAEKRPEMFFEDLTGLENTMWGHGLAFKQLSVITERDSFDACFCAWLKETQSVSVSAGWACAVSQMAEWGRENQRKLFFKLVRAFLVFWRADQSNDVFPNRSVREKQQ